MSLAAAASSFTPRRRKLWRVGSPPNRSTYLRVAPRSSAPGSSATTRRSPEVWVGMWKAAHGQAILRWAERGPRGAVLRLDRRSGRAASTTSRTCSASRRARPTLERRQRPARRRARGGGPDARRRPPRLRGPRPRPGPVLDLGPPGPAAAASGRRRLSPEPRARSGTPARRATASAARSGSRTPSARRRARSASPSSRPACARGERLARYARETLTLYRIGGGVPIRAADMQYDFADILATVVERNASDLHITPGVPPDAPHPRLAGAHGRHPAPDADRHARDRLLGPQQLPAPEAGDGEPARLLLRGARQGALPRQRLLPARLGQRRLPPDPVQDGADRAARACRPSSASSPRSRAASCSSPARPAPASRPRSPR